MTIKTGTPSREQALLIFPHQLFANHPTLEKANKVYIVQDPLFFGDPE